MASTILENVTKIFPPDVLAVDNVSLEIHDKEFLVLVGPSGCGKSTVLRMIAGLEQPGSGRVLIGEHDVTRAHPKDRDIAMVFQDYALYPHMTVAENLGFGLKMRKCPASHCSARVKEVAELLDLTVLLDRLPRQLSGGQRQRVAVGRAIARNPAVFLFDEPLSNLDACLRIEMRAELKKLHHRLQTTTIYVTHDQVEAMTLGDRVAVMNHGVLQQVGTPLQIYDFPSNKFVAGFLGTPPMNFLKGQLEVHKERLHFTADDVRFELPASIGTSLVGYTGKKIDLGVRPENVRIGGPAVVQNDICIQAQIEVIEHLGNEILLYVRTGNNTLIGKAGPHHSFSVDDTISVTINGPGIHFFDAETGKNLSVSKA